MLRSASGELATLRLVAVRERATVQAMEQFSLVLRGSTEQAVDGGIYLAEHAKSGAFPLRLDPSGYDEQGLLYRADFSLLI